MQKSKIEWTDYSINPVKGLCPMACSYCYARRMYKRFHWNPEIRYDDSVFSKLPKEPSRIFVGSTIDLFHEDIDGNFCFILDHVRENPQHTFIFLTKNPQNLPSEFPDNCWVGVSCTDYQQYGNMLSTNFQDIKAKVKFVSFEPLLSRITVAERLDNINWAIIGQQTPVKKTALINPDWIGEIITACDKSKIPVFLKDNLIPMIDELPDNCFTKKLSGDMDLRQEFPVVSP